jgi:hypothetical protein
MLDGGEPIGGKAAIACSEPLTQATLHAIHNAGGGGASVERIVRTSGCDRFEELLSVPKTKGSSSVLTIKLYNDTKEACNDFVCEHETFLLNDLWKECYICVSQQLPEFLYKVHPNIDFSQVEVSEYHIVMTIDLSVVADFNISIIDIIHKLATKIGYISFISGYAVNTTLFQMYIFFQKAADYEKIHNVELRLTQPKPLIIHGSYIKNCFIRENANNPGHFLIECNDIPETDAYNTIIKLPGVDPTGCKCNDMRECFDVLGVCETNARHYEELIYTAVNLSATSGVLSRHYKVLADAIYASGEAVYASRNSFKNDRKTDTIRYVQFETAKEMIKAALKYGDINTTADQFSAIIFNDLPASGCGASKVFAFQNPDM